jgi:DNA repair exonuclease SbcCD ATPase subunit
MLTERQIQILKSENEYLLIQIEDLNQAIAQKEQELETLRQTAKQAAELQSRIDINLLEFEQMQRSIGQRQQKAAGDSIMIEELEKELLDTMKTLQKYSSLADENESLKASLQGSEEELDMASGLYKKVTDLKKEISLLKSEIEIKGLEIENLKEDIQELKIDKPRNGEYQRNRNVKIWATVKKFLFLFLTFQNLSFNFIGQTKIFKLWQSLQKRLQKNQPPNLLRKKQ